MSVIEEITNLPAGSDTGDKGLNNDRNGEHTDHLLGQKDQVIVRVKKVRIGGNLSSPP